MISNRVCSYFFGFSCDVCFFILWRFIAIFVLIANSNWLQIYVIIAKSNQFNNKII
jgi:hypothetical protein